MEPVLHSTDGGGLMETLQLAGKIIIENGGETYRVEETICRMGEGFGLREVECFAVPSGIFISYRNAEGALETGVKRVRGAGRNLMRVDEVNRISRQAAAGKIDGETALAALRKIEGMTGTFGRGWGILAAFLCAAGFAAMFGGGWADIAAAGGVAAIVQIITMLPEKAHMSWIGANIIGGFLTALLPMALRQVIPALLTEAVTAGAVMPLVPGLAMTTAVQDAVRGDMVSGLSHGARALMTACLIAGGALMSSLMMRMITGGGLG